MTEREKIAHLLRRFGLGAGQVEVDKYFPLGVEGATERLINYDQVDEQFDVTPWEFAAYENGTFLLDPTPITGWWALRMLMSQRPLQQKLALFWHNHFAVSGEKVTDGPSMLDYLETIQHNANGNFRTLLSQVCKSTAMMFYLDTQTSDKNHPNENFAREVMELFTLGIGHYSEKDIQEAARAFTGWGIHYSFLGQDGDFGKLQQSMALEGRSVFAYCYVPSRHDDRSKTILGQTKTFEGDAVIDLLATQPRTASFITEKLARWFIGDGVTPALLQHLTEVFTQGNLEIKPVLFAIARSAEFWASAAVRSLPKSPVDFSVAMFRQLGLQEILLQLRGKFISVKTPLRAELKGSGAGLGYLMYQQGLLLLYPPNVGGWNWGKAWISSSNSATRWRHADVIFVGDDKNRPLATFVAQRMTSSGAKDSRDVVRLFCEFFDAAPNPAQIETLVAAAEKAGGATALADKEAAAQLLGALGRVLFATPEFQLC